MARGKRPVRELATAYLKHYRTKSEKDSWAFDEVFDRVTAARATAADAWSLVLTLIELADEDSLGYVGAGPLEDAVRHFGVELIDQLEVQARLDPKFRAALGVIWLSYGDLPPNILSRVVAASDGRIQPLGSRGA